MTKDSAVYFSHPGRLRSGAIFVDGERQVDNDPSLFIPVGEELSMSVNLDKMEI
jgi:hypothetical protein